MFSDVEQAYDMLCKEGILMKLELKGKCIIGSYIFCFGEQFKYE